MQPRGGKSLRVGLDFEGTGVTGQMEWDVCFVVVFKVGLCFFGERIER